jgi:hypothetical protein
MTLADVLSRLESVKPISGGHMARCPAHQDDTASLSVTEGRDRRILLHCHAGCDTRDITDALGVTLTDLFPEKDRVGLGEPTAVYDYRDEHGTLIYQSLRYPSLNGKKTFRQRHPDGAGGWVWKMQGVRRLPYRLDKLHNKEAVVIVEGEKDADRLASVSIPATTNSGGAGKWQEDLTAQLVAAGIKRVVVLPDNDPPGEAHGLLVARSCDDAGLFVKRILLPGLPEHGDVSDWLDAGHTKAELIALIKAAPPFKSNASVVLKPKLELTSLADLLAEPDDAIEWLVDDRIPGGGLVLFAGKPKAGKSTVCRALAFCVAAGEPWLGHHVVMGPVWYLALEDKRSEVRRHFRAMGATGQEPLWMLVGEAPQNCLALLEERAKVEKPVLIIVDTLQRLIQAKDMSDYAEVTTKFSPLLKLCRETGAACVVLHHANKYGEGLDCILGSTALSGSVDNIFIMGRGDHERTLQSIQRIGDDLEPTVVTLDPDTGHVALTGTKREAEVARSAELILEALRGETDAQTERWIREHVEAAPKSQAQALRMMLRRNWVYRLGEGRRGNPYVYGIVSEGSKPPKPEYVSENTGLKPQNGPENDPVLTPKQHFPPCKKQVTCEKPESPCTSIEILSTGTRQDQERVLEVSTSGQSRPEQHDDQGVNGSRARTYSGFVTSDNGEVDDSLFANPDHDENED